jgi:photosystem II stability/assembly factor-like uncharacterized protein
VVAAIGIVYLRPWQAFAPAAAPPSRVPTAAPTAWVRQMQFVSANQGWVVTGNQESASLLHTTDGGRHWQRQLDGVAGDGWTLSFFDARRGMLYGADRLGAELWATTDGGQRWTRTAMSCLAPPLLVFFLDLDHGWCVQPSTSFVPGGPAPPLLPDRQVIALYRTADGGRHWSRVLATDDAQPVSGGLADDGGKLWIWFRDAKNGWIGQRTPGASAVIYVTADGGDHWSREELAPPRGGWGAAVGTWEDGPREVSAGASPWLAVSPVWQGPQAGELVLVSRYLYRWESPAWSGPLQISYGAGPAVDRADPAHWLAATGRSVLESTDAGKDWQPLGVVPAGWSISRFTMTDREHGWALLFSSTSPAVSTATTGGLARTVDGGRHWTLVRVPRFPQGR